MLERDAMVSAPHSEPKPGRRHQQAEPFRAAVQDRVREDRHEHRIRHARKADEADEQQQIADGRRAPDEAESFDRIGERRRRGASPGRAGSFISSRPVITAM